MLIQVITNLSKPTISGVKESLLLTHLAIPESEKLFQVPKLTQFIRALQSLNVIKDLLVETATCIRGATAFSQNCPDDNKMGFVFNDEFSSGWSHLDQAWLPDGYSQIFRLYMFGPSGLNDYGSATLHSKM